MFFYEDSISAIKEYLKWSPEKIKSVFLGDDNAIRTWNSIAGSQLSQSVRREAKISLQSTKKIVIFVEHAEKDWSSRKTSTSSEVGKGSVFSF